MVNVVVEDESILLGLCQSELNITGDFLNDCNDTISAFNQVFNLGAVFKDYQCLNDGLKFFCDAIYFLCNGSTNVPSFLSEDCVQVRDDQCAPEWRSVGNLLNASLPDCSSFDEGANLTVSDIPVLPCPDNFGVFCGLCLPICGQALPFSDSAVTAYNVWQIILLIVLLTGAIITWIASIIKRKTM